MSTTLICNETQKDQREIKECLHIQNTKQITIINLFLQLLQLMLLRVYKPDSSCSENEHYKNGRYLYTGNAAK